MRFIAKNALFLNNLRTITQEGNMEAREMTPSFSSPFSALTVCNSHFCISKYSKFIFMWSILFCRTPQFRQKLPIWTVYYSFLETKTPWGYWNFILCFVPWGEPKKCISLWTIVPYLFLFFKRLYVWGKSQWCAA